MGESNLRTREKLLPSEKGFTYKAMMEALRWNRSGSIYPLLVRTTQNLA